MNKETADIMNSINNALPFAISYAIWDKVLALQTAAWLEGMEQGREELKEQIRAGSEHYAGDPLVDGPYYVVLDSVLVPKGQR